MLHAPSFRTDLNPVLNPPPRSPTQVQLTLGRPASNARGRARAHVRTLWRAPGVRQLTTHIDSHAHAWKNRRWPGVVCP